ncbi:MAG: acyltransferase family protein [Sandaracinaceae bacterium]|nr:acyltransferase family protein [Sandaracinaceae bacterium]
MKKKKKKPKKIGAKPAAKAAPVVVQKSKTAAKNPKRAGRKAKAKVRKPARILTPGVHMGAHDMETFAEADMPRFEDLAPPRVPSSPSSDHAVLEREEDDFEDITDLRTTNYYDRQWGRAALRSRAESVDDFGLDPIVVARMRPLFELVYRNYFRVETVGVENIPAEGRTLIVANHSGSTFPWDGVMLKTALRAEHSNKRELRWLAEDFIFHMPFLGSLMNRIGAVRACQENAERLLTQDKLVAVFPEGIQGIGKHYKQRYQLQRFGRGGYIKLALRSGAPLIPTAVVGAEETNPLLFKESYFAKALGVPYIPVTPTFPLLGPLGLLPLPTKWRIVFGAPISLEEYGPEAANDAIVVNRLNEKVRATLQTMIDDSLAARGSVLFG